ncbi:MAG: carboxypeptidase-like regulatory domain-containing protein [Opitutaceae bacterium]|nr:carboxypeptidase-like regulatory domain-containing protein [Opitutaceae bacterium]
MSLVQQQLMTTPGIPSLIPVRGSLAMIVLVLTAANLRAGDITGRVSDPKTGNYVVGASILDVGTNRETISDREGRYSLRGLPAGPTTLLIDSIGYDTKSEKVLVPESGSIELNVLLGSEVVQLGTFTVEGARMGRAKALQQKRTALKFKDIISADAVGNLPDRNVAEALSRVAASV